MTFAADSSLATLVAPSGGYRRGKLQAYGGRTAYQGVVVHTTGRGVIRRSKQWKLEPFVTALRIYRNMNASGHYVVGQGGECAQTCPEEVVAWGVGGKKSKIYRNPKWATSKWIARRHRVDLAWWVARWQTVIGQDHPGPASPYDLAEGHLWDLNSRGRRSCNSNVLHIEVVPPEGGGAWSEDCWDTLVSLIMDIVNRRQIRPTVERILTHSDAHPIARTTRKGIGWDPPPGQWTYSQFANRAHLPLVGVPTGQTPTRPV